MDLVVRKEENSGNANMVECHYKGTTVYISAKMFHSIAERMQYDTRKFVRYKEGAQIYGMCEREFNKLAHDANAVYKRDRLALVKLELIDKYLEEHREDGL